MTTCQDLAARLGRGEEALVLECATAAAGRAVAIAA